MERIKIFYHNGITENCISNNYRSMIVAKYQRQNKDEPNRNNHVKRIEFINNGYFVELQ